MKKIIGYIIAGLLVISLIWGYHIAQIDFDSVEGAELGAGSGSGYPAAIDTDTSVESSTTIARADVPNDLADAIVNIQAELGTDPAGSTDTVTNRFDYELAFLAQPDGTQTNISTGTNVTVIFHTEHFDEIDNFASNIFTAPLTRKYHFDVCIRLETFDTGAKYYYVYLITSNRTYKRACGPLELSGDAFYLVEFSVTADMTANDMAYVAVYQDGGTVQTDIHAESWFSGHIINY